MQVQTAISEVSVILMGPLSDMIGFLFLVFCINEKAQLLHFPDPEEKL